MNYEILIYLTLAVLFNIARRVISGIKNGVVYAEKNRLNPEGLKKYQENLHFAETPAWYSQFFGLGFLLMGVARLLEIPFFLALGISSLITMGTSAVAGPLYQGFINLGAGWKFINNDEPKKSEFALGPISFWWPRPWWGWRRILFGIMGAGMIGWGMALLFNNS